MTFPFVGSERACASPSLALSSSARRGRSLDRGSPNNWRYLFFTLFLRTVSEIIHIDTIRRVFPTVSRVAKGRRKRREGGGRGRGERSSGLSPRDRERDGRKWNEEKRERRENRDEGESEREVAAADRGGKDDGGNARAARGAEISPRVFGPCLPSSFFVPELRLFSWPSFSRFIHPWAQGRARARKRERENRKERSGATRRGSEERNQERKEDEVERRRRRVGRNAAERRKKRREEEGPDGTYGSPCNRRLRRRVRARGDSGEIPMREWGAGGGVTA